MHYGVVLLAGLLAAVCCGEGKAAPASWTEHAADGVVVAAPPDWGQMSPERLEQIRQLHGDAIILLGIRGPAAGSLPLITLSRRKENVPPMSDSEVAAWCGTVRDTLKKQSDEDIPEGSMSCEKLETESGAGLLMRMTMPLTDPPLMNVTCTLPLRKGSLVATAAFRKADEARFLPVVEEIFASIRLTK